MKNSTHCRSISTDSFLLRSNCPKYEMRPADTFLSALVILIVLISDCRWRFSDNWIYFDRKNAKPSNLSGVIFGGPCAARSRRS